MCSKCEKASHLISYHLSSSQLISFYVTFIYTYKNLCTIVVTFCVHFCVVQTHPRFDGPLHIHIVQHPFKWNLLWANHIYFSLRFHKEREFTNRDSPTMHEIRVLGFLISSCSMEWNRRRQ